MIIAIYATAVFVCLSVVKTLGGGITALCFVFVPMAILMFIVIYLMTVGMNLSIKSGCFSQVPIIDPATLESLSPEEISNVLHARAIALQKEGHFDERFFDEDAEKVRSLYATTFNCQSESHSIHSQNANELGHQNKVHLNKEQNILKLGLGRSPSLSFNQESPAP